MINVITTKHTVSVFGHAGYAPRGADIVCAGMSALFFTLVEALDIAGLDKYVRLEDPGRAYIEFYTARETLNKETQAQLKYFETGAQMLAEQYPDNVRVKIYKGGS